MSARMRVLGAFAAVIAIAAVMIVMFVLPIEDVEACCVYGQPPAISSFSCSPNPLWPPNHKMVDVVCTIEGTTGDPPVFAEWVITSVGVTDTDGGAGDPNNDPDYDGVPSSAVFFPDELQTIQLRAERSGKGTGRSYQLTATACNAYGCATGATNVQVPHDQRPE